MTGKKAPDEMRQKKPMGHGIEKPIDRLFSTESDEWHGLAEVVTEITDETVSPLLFEIVRGGMILDLGVKDTVEEMKKALSALLKTENLHPSASPSEFMLKVVSRVRNETRMSNHQGLAADYRTCRPELIEIPETSGGLVPLHVPKNSYVPISNREVWEQMKKALKDLDAKVSCVGTLEAGKKFFISAQLGDGGGSFEVNGDKFNANLNFITSHDGSFAVEAFDSMVRIVCMNTLRWSREAASEMKFKVYHSSNAALAMNNLGPLVNRILSGRATFKNQMEYLLSVAISREEAKRLVLGYFFADQSAISKKPISQLATNSFNAAEEIVRLYRDGKGNKGQTLFDLLNGATEYWTGGDGTGQDTSKEERAYKANFGTAMEHKSAFVNLLLSGEDSLAAIVEKGKELELAGPRKRGSND